MERRGRAVSPIFAFLAAKSSVSSALRSEYSIPPSSPFPPVIGPEGWLELEPAESPENRPCFNDLNFAVCAGLRVLKCKTGHASRQGFRQTMPPPPNRSSMNQASFCIQISEPGKE